MSGEGDQKRRSVLKAISDEGDMFSSEGDMFSSEGDQ